MRISKLVLRTAVRIVFYFFILLCFVLLLFQVRPVQTYFTKQVLASFSDRTSYETSIGAVKITWLDQVEIDELLILDQKQDTMVYADNIALNYQLKDLFSHDFLSIEKISASDAILRLVKHDSTAVLNLIGLLNELRRENPRSKRPIRVRDIEVSEFEFSFDDQSKREIEERFDFSHFRMDFPIVSLSDFSLRQDTIKATFSQLVGREEKSDFEIEELEMRVNINSQSLSMTDLSLRTPTSQVSDSIKLYYNGLDDLSTFVDSVSFGLYLSNTVLSQEDIAKFIGENPIKSELTFDGEIWGSVGDFNMDDSRVGFGEESFIEGGLSSFGLPNLASTFVLADITDSHLATQDLEDYVGKFSDNVSQLGRLDFTGSFAGFLNDFVARGDLITERGSIHSDINLKIPDNPEDMRYSGNLELKSVDLGAFLDRRDLFQEVNLKGQIIGQGITPENANFDLNAIAFESNINGYQYDTIKADGNFASNLFKGNFEVIDPNCVAQGFADIDFNREEELLKVNIDVGTAGLMQLNLALDTIVTGGKVTLDIVDLSIDDFKGTAKIDSAFLSIDDNQVLLDSINFLATLENGVRNFTLSFPGVEATLEGQFKITDAIKDLTMLASDYYSKIQLVDDTIAGGSDEKYRMQLFAQVDNLSRYLDSLKIPLEIPDGSILEAIFRESKGANLSVYAEADYIKVGKHTIFNPVLEANGARDFESGKVLTNFIFTSDDQEFFGIPKTNNMLVEGVWFNDTIDLTTSIEQQETSSKFRFETGARLTKDSISIKMKPSEIIAFGDPWTFKPGNTITVYPEYVSIKDFEIHNATESIEIEGVYSDSLETKFEVIAQNLGLDKVSLFSKLDVEGLLDGDVNIFRVSGNEAMKFDGGFKVTELSMNDFFVGNIIGSSEWDPSKKRISSRVTVNRQNFKSIDLNGYYYPLEEYNQLDFDLDFDHADLRLLQPFFNSHTSDLSGSAQGQLKITGTVLDPLTNGSCEVKEGKVKIDYLNTTYTYAGNLEFQPSLIRFRNFEVRDRKEATASVTGSVTHRSFKNVVTDISVDAQNFEFLNTTSIDNSLYYGTANGTGNLQISGPINDLFIKASMRTENGTRFYVPIAEEGDVAQQEYIAFVNFSDTVEIVEQDEQQLQGLTLDFEVEVTPDAYCELIFDIKTGDIIRGRGRGNIKLSLDTDGEFHMFGPLEITDGAYNFTVPGFINKEFEVSPGSRVTWFGDPYNASIALNALYFQRTDFSALKSNENEVSELDDRVGMNVILKLTGGMAAPAIDFDLQLADQVDITSLRQSKLAQIVNDEQELKRQVISLLFFRRFSPLSSFTLGGAGNVGNSVSEFFSNQVSYLVSQLDENLEVEVDLASLDKNAFNTFQLRLAYTFLDGRLKVTRGGDFQNEQGTGDKLLEDIVGDWSVEYSLTKDGRLRAKIFRTTNQQISSTLGTQNYESGISLRFVHSFNEFSALLTSKRAEAIKANDRQQLEGTGGSEEPN